MTLETTDCADWDDEEQNILEALGWSQIGRRGDRLIYGRPAGAGDIE